jgi:hypothetical protein
MLTVGPVEALASLDSELAPSLLRRRLRARTRFFAFRESSIENSLALKFSGLAIH